MRPQESIDNIHAHHQSCERKQESQDWEITIRKPNAFQGDSNLSRIQAFNQADLQIDSYPGRAGSQEGSHGDGVVLSLYQSPSIHC
ncbi:hypothetical protein SKAU_G00394590 [Synaphobranchus kaupii]|uniref:Uncharacterized protein n=1 Tax=Synaphobranchus kaupii TaxID=118154 RepID=A0A9Q1EC81_SYNKA|nr:hypothetical protein SKAU_G00394590 [Synaphobranchus kaupii]